jgi:hypothetical protein
MVMSPHPEQVECSEKLPDGTVIRLRYVRPEDERLLQDLAAHEPRGYAASFPRRDARIEP